MADIKSLAEQMVANATGSLSQVNIVDPLTGSTSTTSVFQSPKFVFIFLLVISLVSARVFSNNKKQLPPGVKPLPRLPGTDTFPNSKIKIDPLT